MTEQRRTALKELQKLDTSILEAEERIQAFDPRFEEVEEPVLVVEGELGTLRKRSQEMKVEERRLELSITEKRDRLKKLEDRVGSVRNLREEAAVSAELEMVKRSLQNDEQEAYTLLDQIRKSDERIAELEEAYEEARSMVEPKREALVQERTEVEKLLEELRAKRQEFVEEIDESELHIYDAIRGRTGRQAVAELTEDGACGNCFGMVPLQVQTEIRHGDDLIRCEACGVILSAPDPRSEAESEAETDDTTSSDGAAGTEDPDEALVDE
ncbi:MAG: C4-type zinc ribbon domain-containing protein [Gemmatimonadota bacterium]|nr:C4-type zinc ribbon domain-containing protein [Gemmatimonadota bacterium]